MFYKAVYCFVLGVHGAVTSIWLLLHSFFIRNYRRSYIAIILNNMQRASSADITNYARPILNLLSTLIDLLSVTPIRN